MMQAPFHNPLNSTLSPQTSPLSLNAATLLPRVQSTLTISTPALIYCHQQTPHWQRKGAGGGDSVVRNIYTDGRDGPFRFRQATNTKIIFVRSRNLNCKFPLSSVLRSYPGDDMMRSSYVKN